jgi:hypothetical protein
MGKTNLPTSPRGLAVALSSIFPTFEVGKTDPYDPYGAPTFHSIMIDFTTFFGRASRSCSQKQLRSFGALVNQAVRQSGPLENAISTCFLEHLRQIRAERVLRPFLAPAGKERIHA